MTAFWLVFGQLASAMAHVAPAVRKNNRYVKVTVFGDRARLAYILYFGEIPGQKLRVEIDKNKDGTLSDDETGALATTWTQRVKDATSVTVGDRQLDLRWEASDVGMDDRSTTAGAFTIDIVSWACLGGAEARIVLRDKLELPDAGETEVIPEESPGTELTTIKLGDLPPDQLSFDGPKGPLAAGLELAWNAEDKRQSDICRDLAKPEGGINVASLALIAGAAILLAALGAFLVARRRRRAH